jgi:hypothetical protein
VALNDVKESTIPENRRLYYKETWDNLQVGDLVQKEYLDGRRDAFVIKEIKENEIVTMKLRSGYSHVIFRDGSSYSYWVT